MSAESSLLCALVPPGSIEAEVGGVKAALFSGHGLASAEAIPPLIPIAFLDRARLRPGLLSRLNGRAGAGWRIRTREAAWVQGHLYACVDSAGAWESLRTAAEAECGAAGGPFPVAEGFYLGCAEAPPEARDGLVPRIAPRSFSSGTLALMELETSADGPAWWNEVHWEITEERPLRGRRAS